MPTNKILILDARDLTAVRFATTLKNLGTVSEIVDFATEILRDAKPLASVDGGNLYILATLALDTGKIATNFGPKDLAECVLELGLTKCNELRLIVCNSALKNPFLQNKIFLDDFALELRKASLVAKLEKQPCLKVGSFVGYKGYVGYYDNDTVKLEGGAEIVKHLTATSRLFYGAEYVHSEPTAASSENEFFAPGAALVSTQGFDHQSWESKI